MKKILLFFVLSTFALLGKTKKNPDEIVIGTASEYAPFVSLTPSGEYQGFDIDVANLLAKKLNKKLVLLDCGSMPSLIMSINQNRVDAIIWAISITAERKSKMHLIHYQGEPEEYFPVLFRNKVDETIDTIQALENNTRGIICVEAGTSQESILKNYKNLNIKFVDKITDAVMDVKYGKSAALALDNSLVPLTESCYFSCPGV